jgi:hypothetical protein
MDLTAIESRPFEFCRISQRPNSVSSARLDALKSKEVHPLILGGINGSKVSRNRVYDSIGLEYVRPCQNV